MHKGETLEQLYSRFMSISFRFRKDDVPSDILRYYYNSLYLFGGFDHLNNDELQAIFSHKFDIESIHCDKTKQ